MSIETKVVIFGTDTAGDSNIQFIPDDVANVDEDGKPKSAYYPGDSRYFLLIMPDKYRLMSVQTTAGTAERMGAVSRDQVDRLFFVEKDAILSLSQLPEDGVESTWYGMSASLNRIEQQISADDVPCIADLSYSYAAVQYRLNIPTSISIGPEDDDDFPIGVVIYVEVNL